MIDAASDCVVMDVLNVDAEGLVFEECAPGPDTLVLPVDNGALVALFVGSLHKPQLFGHALRTCLLNWIRNSRGNALISLHRPCLWISAHDAS